MPSLSGKATVQGALTLCKFVEKTLDTAYDSGLAWRRIKRFLGQRDERIGMKTRRKPLQAHRRHLPVAVAARASQQIDLTCQTLDKRLTKFGKKGRIFARSSGESRVQSSSFIGHSATLSRKSVKLALKRPLTW